MKKEVSFKCTTAESTLIAAIVKRAVKAKLVPRSHSMRLSMDITACHANGTPCDLAELLDADDSNFAHDVLGIHYNIDRTTGGMANHFLPRCAKSESEEHA